MLGVLFDFTLVRFFSLFGVLAVLLPLVPNFVFAKKEHVGKTDDIDTCSAGVCMLQLVTGFVTGAALIFMRIPVQSYALAIAAGVVLVLYYCVWIGYFKNGCYYPDLYLKKFLGVPVPMTVFKAVYFVLVSLWLGNGVALVLAVVHGICEVMNAVVAAKDLKVRRYV